MSGTYSVPPYATASDSYDVPIEVEDDPSTSYNNESFEQSYSTQRDSRGHTSSAGAGAESSTEDSEAEERHAGEVNDEFLYGDYDHPDSLPANPAGQPPAEPIPLVSSGISPPIGMPPNLSLDPSSNRRAVRINPVPVSIAPRIQRRPPQSAASGSRTLPSGPVQFPIIRNPAVTMQQASVSMIASGVKTSTVNAASAQPTV